MKYYINYSDEIFKKQQNLALKMAKLRGNFDSIIGYSRKDIDINFYEKNKKILSQSKGGGYWLWKPYFIYKTLQKIHDGDYLFYSDSGAIFLNSVDILIKELEQSGQDIMGFELPLIESQWTKKELFINIDCDKDIFINSNQILASFILIKKTDFSNKFFQEYIEYGSNEMNITDINDPKVQYQDFIEHRHDQSIFSLLYKKYHLMPFKDPSQFGRYPEGYSTTVKHDFKRGEIYILKDGRKFRIYNYNMRYGVIIFHYRNGNLIKGFLLVKVKDLFFKLKLNKILYKFLDYSRSLKAF